MNDPVFTHEVFLSHSSKDKAVVRAIAERLCKDGLRVWFDEWEIAVAADGSPPHESRGALPSRRYAEKIEEGLEPSRVLACPAVASGRRRTRRTQATARRRMLCMSASAFGSDWAHLHLSHSQLSTLNHQPSGDPLNSAFAEMLRRDKKERRFIPCASDSSN